MNDFVFNGPDKRTGLSFFEFIRQSPRRRVLPWLGLAGLNLTGWDLYEIYRSPEKQYKTAMAIEKAFEVDFTGIMDDGIICSETLGLAIRIFDKDFPAVEEHPVRDRAALDNLQIPEPHSAGRMAVNLASLNQLAHQSEKPVAISVEGPFTLAGQLAGVEHLARLLIQQPGFAHDLLDFTTATVKSYADALSLAGAVDDWGHSRRHSRNR